MTEADTVMMLKPRNAKHGWSQPETKNEERILPKSLHFRPLDSTTLIVMSVLSYPVCDNYL